MRARLMLLDPRKEQQEQIAQFLVRHRSKAVLKPGILLYIERNM